MRENPFIHIIKGHKALRCCWEAHYCSIEWSEITANTLQTLYTHVFRYDSSWEKYLEELDALEGVSMLMSDGAGF